MIRVLIADDHPIVRQGLKQILTDEADVCVAAEAASGYEVMRLIRKTRLDIVVLDFSMPGPSGLDLLKQSKKEKPKLPVLVLSIHPEEQYAIRAIKAGASGYLSKNSASEDLIYAIRKVAAGGAFVTATTAEQMAQELQAPTAPTPHEILSDREYEIFHLIFGGKTPKEIAGALSLSPKTVSTYRSRILKKMHLKNNAELMHYAFEHRLAH
ncbi:MAG TPA: DNA-binding response regulator [Verrucomicrobia bacterium]|nr:MAG: DNA-binding response regulator [Lentisphaerae bacterium GWF2_57_35]HBA84720.1 DNA-binding response regulator [Verrucomicrobiota bacterium]